MIWPYFGNVITMNNWVLLALSGCAVLVVLLMAVLIMTLLRASRERSLEAAIGLERQRELDAKLAAIGQINAQLTARLQSLSEQAATSQTQMAKIVSERLDAVSALMGAGIEQHTKNTHEHLSKLGERLAVIDAAQAQLAGLGQDVVGLKDILANKQTRGAFGQGRMEAIVRDGLPPSAYDFQFTLTNRSRPDCVIRVPGDKRVMAVDAKFPLESFTAYKSAEHDEARKQAAARIRADMSKHIRDIKDKYLIAGETQDIAILFVPSESIYADLNEHFDDVVQKAHHERVMIVSPSLLMMTIQVIQSLVRDAKMREQAHLIQKEVGALMKDVGLLSDRVRKLDTHFRQAQGDVEQIVTSAEKISRRGDKIHQVEFDEPPAISQPLPAHEGHGTLFSS
jgi:DNA recombination protein RmuC